MILSKKLSSSAAVIGIAVLALVQSAAAKPSTFAFTSTFSGSGAQVSVNLSGSGCINLSEGGYLCPGTAVLGITGGNNVSKGPIAGPATTQAVAESLPEAGTGCAFAPGTIQGCTIGLATDGCLYDFVPGGTAVSRLTATGDLLFQSITSGSICIGVFGPLPWSYEAQEQVTIVGGTGQLSGAAGSFSATFHGAVLQSDSQGHGMSWSAGSATGQITTP